MWKLTMEYDTKKKCSPEKHCNMDEPRRQHVE